MTSRTMTRMPHRLSSRALEFAQTLVRMNTVSSNSNLELIGFVRDDDRVRPDEARDVVDVTVRVVADAPLA